jgi:soluble lytic murein transglycosylase-like protein
MWGLSLAGARAHHLSEEQIVSIIEEAALRHGVSPSWLVAVARCESRLDHRARGALGERGLFQLLPGGELAVFYAWGYTDPDDPYQAADFTAARFAQGQSFRWTCARGGRS